MMSLMNMNNLCASSSSSAFFAPTHFNSRAQSVSLPVKRIGAIKCVAAELTAYTTGVSRNENMAKLQAGYLFPEIARRKAAHLLKYPDAKVISLGIGDTTEPIPEVITSAMAKRCQGLSTLEGYTGYGAEQGEKALRAAIASTYYGDLGIEESDIFVSDGAKCDISRLQLLFGSKVTMAVQDPSYPVISLGIGDTGTYGGGAFCQDAVHGVLTGEKGKEKKPNFQFVEYGKIHQKDVKFFEVWQENLNWGMESILYSLCYDRLWHGGEMHPDVAISAISDGICHVEEANLSAEEKYAFLKEKVANENLVQLSFAFTGSMVWTFHFADYSEHQHYSGSVLEQGKAINVSLFAQKLPSLLAEFKRLNVVTYEAPYVLGTIMSMTTNQLPDSRSEFLIYTAELFPSFYDIKKLIWDSPLSLDQVADKIRTVWRIGSPNHAGSTSLLTLVTFLTMMEEVYPREVLEERKGQVYNVSEALDMMEYGRLDLLKYGWGK